MDVILKSMNKSYDQLTNLQARFMTTDTADAKRGYVHVQSCSAVQVRECVQINMHVLFPPGQANG